MINFDLFFGHDRDLTPPPQDHWKGLFRQLAHVISGGSPFNVSSSTFAQNTSVGPRIHFGQIKMNDLNRKCNKASTASW